MVGHTEDFAPETRQLPVQWRWEGRCGHPRTLVDYLRPALEEQGYVVNHWESELRGEPLSGIAEFEGGLIGKSDYRGFREDRTRLIISLVLSLAVVGLFFLGWTLIHRHRRIIRLEWRGEAYAAGGKLQSEGRSVSQASVVSEARVALRSGAGHADGEWSLRSIFRANSPKSVKGIGVDVRAVVGKLATTVPAMLPAVDVEYANDGERQPPLSGAEEVRRVAPGDDAHRLDSGGQGRRVVRDDQPRGVEPTVIGHAEGYVVEQDDEPRELGPGDQSHRLEEGDEPRRLGPGA